MKYFPIVPHLPVFVFQFTALGELTILYSQQSHIMAEEIFVTLNKFVSLFDLCHLSDPKPPLRFCRVRPFLGLCKRYSYFLPIGKTAARQQGQRRQRLAPFSVCWVFLAASSPQQPFNVAATAGSCPACGGSPRPSIAASTGQTRLPVPSLHFSHPVPSSELQFLLCSPSPRLVASAPTIFMLFCVCAK